MQPIRSILVPVDFSELSANAYRYALRLADHLDASVDLLNVVPPTTAAGDANLITITLTADLVSEAKINISRFFTEGMAAVSKSLKHIPAVRSYVEVGDLRACVRKQIKKNGNQLIVMGTHGSDDGLDDFFGTNTSSLIVKAPCPILVIPQGARFKPLSTICYATDLMHIDAFQAGNLVRALRIFQPRLDFVHVKNRNGEKTNFNMDLLREVFDHPDSAITTRFRILEDEAIVDQVFDYAQESEADLVVMHRPRHGWFNRVFGTSHTRTAVLETPLPLLIVPYEEGEIAEVKANSIAAF